MIHEEHFFFTSPHDGLKLGALLVAPDAPRGLMLIAHGMAEHKERYLPLMRFLAEHAIACAIHDHRGHGESVRSRDDLGFFYENGAEGVVEDLHEALRELQSRFPNAPTILMGHSMGSLAARAFAAKYGSELGGLIVVGSPGLNPGAKFGLWLTNVLAAVKRTDHAKSRLMDALLNGPFAAKFPGKSYFAWLSANADNVRAYERDPLCGFGFTLNGYRALLNLMLAAYDEASPLPNDLPVWFLSGADDPCARGKKGFDHAMENLRRRGSREVSGTMVSGLRHEILNENRPDVWEMLLESANRMLETPPFSDRA